MAERDFLDVLDTAIKIGLGALISGVSTYWVTKLKNQDESRKETTQRRRKILEQAVEEAELVNYIYLKYWALVVEWLRYKLAGNQWPESRNEELEHTKLELFQAFKNISSAEAKLLLIQEKAAYESLRKYGEAVVRFRKTYYKDNSNMTEEKMEQDKQNIRALREEFFSVISASYKSDI